MSIVNKLVTKFVKIHKTVSYRPVKPYCCADLANMVITADSKYCHHCGEAFSFVVKKETITDADPDA